jgi:hypothetical protein
MIPCYLCFGLLVRLAGRQFLGPPARPTHSACTLVFSAPIHDPIGDRISVVWSWLQDSKAGLLSEDTFATRCRHPPLAEVGCSLFKRFGNLFNLTFVL